MSNLLSAYVTSVGIEKQVNQDSLCLKIVERDGQTYTLAMVCDGMGGLSKGELASSSVIHLFSDWFDEFVNQETIELSQAVLKSSWQKLIFNANQALWQYGKANHGMLGTTLTGLFSVSNQWTMICQVGDSRLYQISDSEISQLTEDQSLVQREVKLGRLSKQDAKHDFRLNVLLQCIGANETLEPEFTFLPATSNLVYLICSDGFWHCLETNELLENLKPYYFQEESLMFETTQKLVELVEARKERDNITAVLLKT